MLKIEHVIILMTIKFEDFDFNKVLIDEKSCRTIWFRTFCTELLIGAKPLHIRFDKMVDLLEFIMELNIMYYLVLKNMPFTIGLDTL